MLNIEEYLKYNLNYSYKLINSYFHNMSFIFNFSKISWCCPCPRIWRRNLIVREIPANFLKAISFFHFQKKCTIAWHTQWSYTSDLSLSNTFCCDWHFLTFSLSLCISKFLYASHSSVSLFLFSFVTFSLLFVSPSPFTGSTN